MRYLGILALVAACDGGAVTPDAGMADAVVVPPWNHCDLDLADQVFIVRVFDVLPPDEGRDVNGDGSIDNVIGNFAGVIGEPLNEGIQNGDPRFVTVLDGLEQPFPVGPVDVQFYIPPSQDTDLTDDNFDGDAEFQVERSAYDVDCAPRATVAGQQIGGHFSGYGDSVNFVTSPAGDVRLIELQFEVEIAEGGGTASAFATGAWSACAMDRVLFQGVDSLPVLRTIAQIFQPDIDHDDDGLETIEIDPPTKTVVRCTDGNGDVIQGPSCPCDARIVDGYSAAARFELVSAQIAGLF